MAGIYVHIPYCHSKCSYCDFFSTPNRADAERLVDCILSEYEIRSHEVEDISTIYFGGGTPSILDVRLLDRILRRLPVEKAKEVTLEVNPEDVTPEKATQWRDMGFNRISMGVQSLIDSELQLIGRRHDSQDALRAIDHIMEAGITNYSIDLIYGLPTQTISSWKQSLCILQEKRPPHFSAYILSYEPRTRLSAMLKTGKIAPANEDAIVEMYAELTSTASELGYEHYEISNFALPGYRSRHNSSYWLNEPYLGLGPAAYSFDGKVRRYNPHNIAQYCQAIAVGSPAYTEEKESYIDRYNNLIITTLRTSEGLDFSKVACGRRRRLLCDAFAHLQNGTIEINHNHLIIPEDKWLISDSIFRDLMQ